MTATEPSALRWLVRRTLGEEPGPFPPPEDWGLSLPALDRSRLLPLAVRLLGPDLARLTPYARFCMTAATVMAEASIARARSQLGQLAVELERRGVCWLVLKGLPLAERLYPSPVCRPSADVDLLVDPALLAQADAALQDLSYRRDPSTDPASHHVVYRRLRPGDRGEMVEVHWATDPPSYAPPLTSALLEHRRRFTSSAGEVWILSLPDERDFLVRHFVRHAGCQAILLLDILLHLEGAEWTHPLGRILRDDLDRLVLPRSIDGPWKARHLPLRRWMTTRPFVERLAGRPVAILGLAREIALTATPGAFLREIRRYLWPVFPSPKWQPVARSRWGRLTWRLRRLLQLGT